MDKRLLDIFAAKPDLVNDFPDWMLPTDSINEIRKLDGAAIAEISGRDSIAAVIRACEMRPIQAIVPTITYTATEYGSWEVLFKSIGLLKDRLLQKKIKVFNTVILGSPRFWWELCGRYTTHFVKLFGFFSHCVGCHLYIHIIRIPLAKLLSSNLVIGGERESHDGKLKVNQIGVSLNAYQAFFRKFNVELFLPLRHIKSGREIEEIINLAWDEGGQQPECVLSRNYREPDGTVSFSEDAIKAYFDEFAFQKAEEFIQRSIK
jgi:hypothetical protein